MFDTPTDLLQRAMRSVLLQQCGGLEVIVVDDGSCPQCAADCDVFAEADERVTVLHIKHGGVSSARNVGVGMARGDWVMFVDPDDELIPGILPEALELAEANGLDILYATVVDVRGPLRKPRVMGFEEGDGLRVVQDGAFIDKLREYFVAYETHDNNIVPKALSTGSHARLFKRSVIGDARFDSRLVILEDAIFNSEVVSRAGRVGLLDRPWYLYYWNAGSATKSMDFESDSERHATAVLEYVERAGLPVNAYYSNICTYFFMAASSLSHRGVLSSSTLRKGMALPWFEEAFANIDRSRFQYTKKATSVRYSLACSGHPLLLLAFYRVRELVRHVEINLHSSGLGDDRHLLDSRCRASRISGYE